MREVIYKACVVFLSILVLPVAMLIAVLVGILSGRPVLYRQKRIGLKGNPFWLLKFRTMTKQAEKKQLSLKGLNEATGPVFKIRNDPRFTSIGKFLSHTGLDELPQLWNVLRGEMAIIGPRPLPIDEARQLTPDQHKRERVKPGIISPWIVEGYHKNTFDMWMKSDLLYIQKKSTWYDIVLFVRAIGLFLTLLFRESHKYLKKK